MLLPELTRTHPMDAFNREQVRQVVEAMHLADVDFEINWSSISEDISPDQLLVIADKLVKILTAADTGTPTPQDNQGGIYPLTRFKPTTWRARDETRQHLMALWGMTANEIRWEMAYFRKEHRESTQGLLSRDWDANFFHWCVKRRVAQQQKTKAQAGAAFTKHAFGYDPDEPIDVAEGLRDIVEHLVWQTGYGKIFRGRLSQGKWMPDEAAFARLQEAGIPRAFAMDWRPHFISVFNQERHRSTWYANECFVDYVIDRRSRLIKLMMAEIQREDQAG